MLRARGGVACFLVVPAPQVVDGQDAVGRDGERADAVVLGGHREANGDQWVCR